MTPDAVLAQLQEMGTAQNRKTYARHGIPEPMYGVSFANLGALKKKLNRNQPLADALWASGNHDARILATMIADPNVLAEARLSAWADESTCDVQAAYVGALAAATPSIDACLTRWFANPNDERRGTCAWNAVCELAKNQPALPDGFFQPLLEDIRAHIHERPNRVRYTMLGALIGIGLRNESLRAIAFSVADAIGDVHVDHGDTACKTPQPRPYMEKALARSRGTPKKVVKS